MKGRIGVATALVWATAALAPLTLGAASVAAEDPTTLTIGTTVAIDNPTIWAVNSTTEWMAVNLQYDMLMKFSDEDLSAAPGLATGCEPSPDYRRWTCAIPAGLTWSDGLPLTSKDVAFSYRFVIDQGFPYFEGYFPKDVTFETQIGRAHV